MARTVIHDVEIELISDVDSLDGANSIEVWAPSGRFLTPENARHLAVQLVRVSLQAEGRGRGMVAVAANLVMLAGERQPMDVDDVERLASVLGVSATKLFSNWRSLDVRTAPLSVLAPRGSAAPPSRGKWVGQVRRPVRGACQRHVQD